MAISQTSPAGLGTTGLPKTQTATGYPQAENNIFQKHHERRAAKIGLPSEHDKPEQGGNKTVAKFALLGTGVALGTFFKDGLNAGFNRIGNFTNGLSHLIAVPFSFLLPLSLIDNERKNHRNEKPGRDDIFTRMTYTMASLVFTPLTLGDQLKTATRSPAYMAATIANLPHTLYCMFSYTGARLMGFLTSIKMRFNTDPVRSFRLEQEFGSFYTLGNLGSAQCSIIPMAGQFVTGWKNIFDIFTGNFSSAWERFREEPISAFMGTFFNSLLWPFEYFGKCFDTTIRTAEMVDNIQNASSDPDNSTLITSLRKLRDGWHNKILNPNSGLGNFLKTGRKISMNLATYIPPIGMASVVLPAMNKYFKGEIWNKEAQEVGGTVGLLDKIFSTGAFFGHLFYTVSYAAIVRLPQTATAITFYGSNLINKLTGKKLDPNQIREKMFSWSPVKKLSEWASKKLDKIELELHPDNPVLINDLKDENGNIIKKGTGRNRNIRTLSEVLCQEICMVARENLYKEIVKEEFEDEGLKNENNPTGWKPKGVKPSDKEWGKILDEYQPEILEQSEVMLREYLKKSEMLEPDKVEKYVRKYYWGEGLVRVSEDGRVRTTIREEVEKQLKKEIGICIKPKEDISSQTEPKIKSESLIQLLTNRKELWEVLKLKTFHLTNSFLMMWVRGFTNSPDFGEKGDEYWEKDTTVRKFMISELDTEQACAREFLPVAMYGWQSMAEGLLLMNRAKNSIFSGREISFNQAA